MAALLGLLKLVEYKYFVRDIPLEFYIGLVAILFTILGIWAGLRLTRPKVIDTSLPFELDKNNLESRVKLGNYFLAASNGRPELLAEAERLVKEALDKDANHIEAHILMGGRKLHCFQGGCFSVASCIKMRN